MNYRLITTAISYPNGEPHIGHAYEAVIADVTARVHRAKLLTGTDEHGLKMVKTAREANLPVKALADQNSALFRQMCDDLNIRYERFIRTTDADHYIVARMLWRRMAMTDDIYIGSYEGWYSVRDEAYFTPDDLVETPEGFQTRAGNPVEWITETSYFFRLYRDWLINFHNSNPEWIYPSGSRNEIMEMLSGSLPDISISRTTFDWGIPVPDSVGHVMYVWVDALANYLTGSNERKIDLHIVGRDITKFHAIYWLAFLKSAGLPLPGKLIAHGFLTVNGQRMSKSTGNVLSPFVPIEAYGADRLRYYLLASIAVGRDGDYSDSALVARCNADLSNGFGNLVSRVCKMIITRFPDRYDLHIDPPPLPFQIVAKRVRTLLVEGSFSLAIEEWCRGVSICNIEMQERAPWANHDDTEVQVVLLGILDQIIVLTRVISPVMPETCAKILKYITAVKNRTTVDAPPPFFPRIK